MREVTYARLEYCIRFSKQPSRRPQHAEKLPFGFCLLDAFSKFVYGSGSGALRITYDEVSERAYRGDEDDAVAVPGWLARRYMIWQVCLRNSTRGAARPLLQVIPCVLPRVTMLVEDMPFSTIPGEGFDYLAWRWLKPRLKRPSGVAMRV